jgi:ubiquinone/menaquinone biosynthesis C-methylase UbiE
MALIWVLLAVLLLLDAFRIRGRVDAIRSLADTSDPVSPEHRFLTGVGVVLDEATKRAASAFARENKLEVLDLLPGDLATQRVLGLLQVLDPEKYRRDRLGKGLTAGHAILVSEEVLAKAQLGEGALDKPLDCVTLARVAGKLKRYAVTRADIAVAPELHAVPEDPTRRLATMREVVGGAGVNAVLLGVPVVLALLGVGAAMRGPGFAPLLVFQLQPLVVLAGTRLAPRDLFAVTLFRAPLELWSWIRLLLEPSSRVDPARIAALRPVYAELLKKGTAPFFEPRRTTCPLCDGSDLVVKVKLTDMIQRKPGNFTLERCKGCGHIFQNPRLSIEGLNFYYKDFYDGLGEDDLDFIFGASETAYEDRAKIVAGEAEPKAWLDVGGGHGHFATAAREHWPKTRFDGLDMSESIEEAARRGWVDTGHRGLFPDLAPSIAGQYDVVSMSHYLEHTRDPKAEVDAAKIALREGGLLMIEIPDPESGFGTLFRRYWLPWFQPQHQHFVSYPNLRKILEERGFSLVKVHRSEAHIRVDVSAAAYLFLEHIAPAAERPWLPERGAAARALRTLIFLLGTPMIVTAMILDNTLARLYVSATIGNAFRVLARKGKADEETETDESKTAAPAA